MFTATLINYYNIMVPVPGMNEPVEHLCGLLDEVGLVGVVLQLIVRLQVKDHVQCL